MIHGYPWFNEGRSEFSLDSAFIGWTHFDETKGRQENYGKRKLFAQTWHEASETGWYFTNIHGHGHSNFLPSSPIMSWRTLTSPTALAKEHD